jgi:pSer/pThr/pTyr-binding forkhead associated (FHA) protein
MQNQTRAYKYSCRKCPIRQRCLDDKSYGPGLKMEITRRFANRTDTFETWDLLQQDCLLIRYERQESQDALQESSLSRRLRAARQTPPGGLPPLPDAVRPGPRAPDITPLPTPPARGRLPDMARPAPPPSDASTTDTPLGLIIAASERMVRLPNQGDVIFGRFEHGFSSPPDIDLSLEDGLIPSVSRRHALLISRNGQHWIEDMGSSNGTYVNGHPVSLGQTVQLSSGDRLLLGRCRLIYTTLPDWVSQPDPRKPHTTSLLITHTGDRIQIPDKLELLVGRPDPALGYVPDIDLGTAGDIAMYVSRRHVRLLSRSGWHFLEEVGSAAGTRLNGKPIRLGESPVMLRPGDHIWLGGCVLAYEWKFT